MLEALALAAALTASHPYALSGHANTAGGAEHVTVLAPACASHADVYAESGDGQDTENWPLHSTGHGRWAGVMTFTRADETGRWVISSTVCETARGGFTQITAPAPAFQVRTLTWPRVLRMRGIHRVPAAIRRELGIGRRPARIIYGDTSRIYVRDAHGNGVTLYTS